MSDRTPDQRIRVPGREDAKLPRSARRLGRSQSLVLRLLALGSGAKSVSHLSYDWPGLTESAARSAVMRLGNRALVDVAGWDGVSRTYKLTDDGWRVVGALDVSGFDEEGEWY